MYLGSTSIIQFKSVLLDLVVIVVNGIFFSIFISMVLGKDIPLLLEVLAGLACRRAGLSLVGLWRPTHGVGGVVGVEMGGRGQGPVVLNISL